MPEASNQVTYDPLQEYLSDPSPIPLEHRHATKVEDVEATFRRNLQEAEDQGLAARKERAAAEKVLWTSLK